MVLGTWRVIHTSDCVDKVPHWTKSIKRHSVPSGEPELPFSPVLAVVSTVFFFFLR